MTFAKILKVSILFAAGLMTAAQAPNQQKEADVRAADAELREAIVHADAKTIVRLMAPDCTITHANGKVQTRDQFLEALTSGRAKFAYMDSDNVSVRLYGDAAVMNARISDKIVFKGQESSGQVQVTSVYVLRNGHWVNVAEHATALPKP